MQLLNPNLSLEPGIGLLTGSTIFDINLIYKELQKFTFWFKLSYTSF
jgi:hypothetical protein